MNEKQVLIVKELGRSMSGLDLKAEELAEAVDFIGDQFVALSGAAESLRSECRHLNTCLERLGGKRSAVN